MRTKTPHFPRISSAKTQRGTTLSTEWRAETLSVKSELLFDFSGNEQSWKSINIREGTNVTVTHAGDSLVLTGTFSANLF